MPLHEFIDDPVVHDIVHNGATFQVILNQFTHCMVSLKKKKQSFP